MEEEKYLVEKCKKCRMYDNCTKDGGFSYFEPQCVNAYEKYGI